MPGARTSLAFAAEAADTATVDKAVVHDELEQTHTSFHALLDGASAADLRRPSAGTRWTNRQLLFHMLLGYLIIRALSGLVRLFGRLPDGASRGFARLLNAGTVPFDAVNFAGSWLGGTLLPRRWMRALFDRTSRRCTAAWTARPTTTSAAACTPPLGGTRSSGTT